MRLCPTVKALIALEIEALWEEDKSREQTDRWALVYLRLRSMYRGPLYGHPEEIDDETMPHPNAIT